MNLSRLWPLLLGTGITLGLGAPIAKAASEHGVGALAFALWPTLAAGVLLGAIGLLRQGRPADLPRLIRFGGVAGLFGHALPMSALFWLSSHAGAGFASLSLALPPVFTLLVSLLLGLERPALRRGAAVGLGLSGAMLMLAGRGGSFEATAAVLAIALAIPASIGGANVYRSRHMPPGASGEWMSSGTLLASSSMLALAGLAFGGIGLPLTAPALGWLALQAGVLTIGYLLYFALQRRAEPVTFSFIGYVMMLAGVAIGTLVFGERLPWTVWPASGLVLAALLLLQAPARRHEPVDIRHGQGTPA
ncbi:DMT family transporter [uncultured Piscinibacter sp.]|uniref:DMT family transporter n=1 Tax=uncultured Piscinibacter sp. TaxID=1131835 RepID=UPI002618B1FB|nr:DMT family transporter [uncultured Piscinibacter sp.]